MRRVLLDADAFLCLRALGLLHVICTPTRAGSVHITEYVARHELNSIDGEVRALEQGAAIVVQPVGGGSSAVGKRWKEFRREMDKGEAEAVAWALEASADLRPIFITRETRAIRQANERGVVAMDVFALVCAAVLAGWVSREQAKQSLAVWTDAAKEICRPRDYEGFDGTYAKRASQVRTGFAL